MPSGVLSNKDFWGGLMLVAIGATTMALGRDYPFGSALRMGPGYFPTVLGGLMILFGLYVLATGLRASEKLDASWPLRALIVLPLALCLFGFLIERAGFIPAMLVLVFGSSLASREFRLIESILFTVFMTALCAAVFVWALDLNYPLIVLPGS